MKHRAKVKIYQCRMKGAPSMLKREEFARGVTKVKRKLCVTKG